MFDSIGFQELVIIGIIALIVVGPKELPLLMRKAGQWMSRLRGMALSRQARLFDLLGEPAAAVAARDRFAVVLAPWKDRTQVAGTIADHHVESSRVLTTQGDRRAAIDRLERALAVAPDERKPDIASRLESISTAPGSTP
jgi:sec-independent protein translocase protein TatB